MNKKNYIGMVKLSGISIGLGTAFTWLLGDIDDSIKILATLMVLDMVSGVMMAYNEKNLSSVEFGKGIKRKVMSLFLIILAVQIDTTLGSQWTVRSVVIWSLIAYEGLSILEHAGEAGVPIPDTLKNSLIQLKSKTLPYTTEELEEIKENIKRGEKYFDAKSENLIKDIEKAKKELEDEENSD